MVGVRAKIEGAVVNRLLSRLLINDAKRTEMLGAIGEASVQEIRLLFIYQRQPNGVKWKVSKRAENDPSHPTMLNTLKLMNSIVFKRSRMSVEIGTSDIRAGTLNFGAKKGQYGATRTGTPIPFGDIPARQFIGVSSQHEKRVAAIVTGFLRSW